MAFQRRTARRMKLPAVAIAIALAAGAGIAAPAAGAIVPSCSVVREGQPAYDTLQAAVDAAAPGETLVLSGLCEGQTLVYKSVTIRGATEGALGVPAEPVPPTLNGAAGGTTLRVENGAIVTLEGLTITGGTGTKVGFYTYGGNLWVEGGATVTLKNTQVVAGRADSGAGMYAFNATIRMVGTSVFSDGVAAYSGGAIRLVEATLVMSGRSSIRDNTAHGSAGGVYLDAGTMTMKGRASVRANQTEDPLGEGGGGLYLLRSSRLTMTGKSRLAANTSPNGGGLAMLETSEVRILGSAAVVDNTANGDTAAIVDPSFRDGGGGIWSDGTGMLVLSGQGTIHDNTAAVAGAGGGVRADGMTLKVGAKTVTCRSRLLRPHLFANTPENCVS